jgi:hypothetical protein
MGFLQQVKAGKITATEAKKQLLEKAKKNNEEHFARNSSTWRKLEKLEAK